MASRAIRPKADGSRNLPSSGDFTPPLNGATAAVRFLTAVVRFQKRCRESFLLARRYLARALGGETPGQAPDHGGRGRRGDQMFQGVSADDAESVRDLVVQHLGEL